MKKILISIILFILGIAIGVGGIKAYEHFSKDDNKETTKEETTKEVTNCKEEEQEETTTKLLTLIPAEQTENEDGLYIDNQGNLLVGDKVIDTDVVQYIEAPGFKDICDGGTYFYFLKSDGTVSAFSDDDLTCGGEIKYTKNLMNLKNITYLYVGIGFEGEASETVVAMTESGKENILQELDTLYWEE